MNKCIVCVCDKVCTSRAGLTLHQRNCAKVKEALAQGLPIIKESEIIMPKDEFVEDVRNFLELAEVIAYDANLALSNGNKSAGRRSRTGMIKLRDIMTPLRKKILEKMK